jgi:hypothetical protein
MRSQSFPLVGGAVHLPADAAESPSDPFGRLAAVRRHRHSASGAAGRQQGWLLRLEYWFAQQRWRDRDAYLARSKDVFELEARIRDLGRQSPTRYY